MANKNTRQVRNVKINTVEVVNQALANVADKTPDLADARRLLGTRVFQGLPAPTEEEIAEYAQKKMILSEIQRLSGAMCANSDQVRLWDFTSAETIHASFDSYLNRRVSGMRARWTENQNR